MFKSLLDLCRDEIKALLAKPKNKETDENLIRNTRSVKKAKVLDENFIQEGKENFAKPENG
jgi:hypothetical protein